jgi:hypothetical protein
LDPRKWIDITLVHREEISHDTRRFRFELPGAQEGIRLGLPVGLHVLLGAYIGDQLIVRPYTPIGPVIADEDQGPNLTSVRKMRHADKQARACVRACVGYVEFVIKIYFSNKSKAFPRVGYPESNSS